MTDSNQKKKSTYVNVEEAKISRVYAEAVINSAVESGEEAAVVEELNSLVADVFDTQPQFETLLSSALIGKDEKAEIIDRVFSGRMSPRMLSFVKVLNQHGRLNCLRAIQGEAEALHNERNNRIPAELVLAADIDEALTKDIYDRIVKGLGVEPILQKRIDPSLIAGFVLTIGDKVFDGSTKNRFAKAKRAMLDRSVEMIQTQRETLLED